MDDLKLGRLLNCVLVRIHSQIHVEPELQMEVACLEKLGLQMEEVVVLAGILVDGMDMPVVLVVVVVVGCDNCSTVVVGHGHYNHSEDVVLVVLLDNLGNDDIMLGSVLACHLVRQLELFLVIIVGSSSAVDPPGVTCNVVNPIRCS